MEYRIKQTETLPDWSSIEHITVSNYPWGGSYQPNVTVKAVLVRDQYFAVHMECEERSPRAMNKEDNSNIYEDSCMECFINFKPDASAAGYINLEANANGALYSGYGKDGSERTLLSKIGLDVMPSVTATVMPDKWICDFRIPLASISKIYGDAEFSPGDVLRGNFLKCGDKTHTPHYGAWTLIDNPTPAFHMPQYFGTLIIE